MIKRIYVAAPWAFREHARRLHHEFRQAGFDCVSDWTERPLAPQDSEATLEHEAVTDLLQLEKADALVIFNLGKSEGKATELGYALHMDLPIVLVGPRDGNVFYNLRARVRQVRTPEAAIEALRAIPANEQEVRG